MAAAGDQPEPGNLLCVIIYKQPIFSADFSLSRMAPGGSDFPDPSNRYHLVNSNLLQPNNRKTS